MTTQHPTNQRPAAFSRLPPDRPQRGSRAPWAVLGLLILLTLALTWPVAAHLSTRVPGTATWAFDESTFLWNNWYFQHALLDLHTSPLHTELIWYPLGIDLVLHTYDFFNALIALPLQLAFNVPLASNITLLLATVLSGLGAHLLALYVLRGAGGGDAAAGRPRPQHLAALAAGLIYAFASNRAVYAALGHYDMVTTQWLPFCALYLLKTLREPRLRNAALAGIFFGLAALAEMIFAVFLALFALVVVLASWRGLAGRRQALGRLGLAALIALLIWAPVLVPIAREFVTGDYALQGWGESVPLSADLAGLVTPTDLNPLFAGPNIGGSAGHWQAALRAVQEGQGRFNDVNTVFLGWVTLALALAGAWAGRRRLQAWIASALVFGVLALGPLLQIGGRYRFSLDNLLPEGVTFPLPFALLHFVPLVSANRAPNRNSVILMLALAVLASQGLAWLLRARPGAAFKTRTGRLAAFGMAGLLCALVLIEHLAVPLPTTEARVPEVYQQLAEEPGQFAIMQLPLGWRNSFGVLGSEQTQLQYFQTAHDKPIIGGNISRAPDIKMAYFARIPLFRALADLEMYREVSAEMDAAARSQAGALMALYDVRYLVLTPPIADRYPYKDTWQQTEAYALDVLPLEDAPAAEQDGYRVYRVIQPAVPLPFRLDLGAAGTEPYAGAGWDFRTDEQPYGATGIWATEETAELYLPLDAASVSAARVTLRLAVAPYSYEGAPAQSMTVALNGGTLGRFTLTPGWQVVEVQAPGELARRGPNRVTLAFAWALSPRNASSDPASRALIGGTGVVSPVNVDVHSFEEAFISTFDRDAVEVKASAGRRGYNVAVLDPATGRVLDMRGFDTAANSYEADALADYLTGIPAGRIVVLATKGDATANLTPAAIEALRGLGSGVTGAGVLAGQAHALVGVQGAASGAAAEAIAPGDAFLRVAGDFRTLAAAVDWVELDVRD